MTDLSTTDRQYVLSELDRYVQNTHHWLSRARQNAFPEHERRRSLLMALNEASYARKACNTLGVSLSRHSEALYTEACLFQSCYLLMMGSTLNEALERSGSLHITEGFNE